MQKKEKKERKKLKKLEEKQAEFFQQIQEKRKREREAEIQKEISENQAEQNASATGWRGRFEPNEMKGFAYNSKKKDSLTESLTGYGGMNRTR